MVLEMPHFQAFRGRGQPRFANRAELECAKLLDYYGVPWDYEPRTFVLVVPLRGSFIFGVDLSRSLALPHEIDYVELEPFHRGERGVRLIKDLDGAIDGRDVLLAVDVVDTGLTMHYLCRTLRLRNP